MRRKTIYEWAKEYCGDPESHEERGSVILEFLKEQGLCPHHKVLDVGCGALSQGAHLIHYLNKSNYTGIDPNGWLIEAALQQIPHLEAKTPSFSYASDFFDGSGPYDYVVAHSVLSHVADWQLDQALTNVRRSVEEGAIWIASLRLDQYDQGARAWVYPGVSYFRIETVKSRAHYWGWYAEHVPEYRERLTDVCPNDFHDWIKFTAIPTSEEMNEMRISEAQREKEAKDIYDIAFNIYLKRLRGEEDAE